MPGLHSKKNDIIFAATKASDVENFKARISHQNHYSNQQKKTRLDKFSITKNLYLIIATIICN